MATTEQQHKMYDDTMRYALDKYTAMDADELLQKCIQLHIGPPMPPSKENLISLLMEWEYRNARRVLGLTSDLEASED